MTKETLKKRKEILRKARKSEENPVNLQSQCVQELVPEIAGFPLRKGATNQLWHWDTLEDVNFK